MEDPNSGSVRLVELPEFLIEYPMLGRCSAPEPGTELAAQDWPSSLAGCFLAPAGNFSQSALLFVLSVPPLLHVLHTSGGFSPSPERWRDEVW